MRTLTKTAVLLAITGLAAPLATLAQDHGHHAAKDGHHADTKAAAKLPHCPVMDEPIDFSVQTMTKDGPVYFCCKMCIDRLKQSPAKYASKVTAQREALAKMDRVQVGCPISGKPIDGKTFAEVDGKRVDFCCPGCMAKYKKDPAAYQAKLLASYTYQTKCPVAGEKIIASSFVDLATGQRVFFCCPGCDKRFLADPGKYAPKLAAQGVHVDLKKLKAGKDAHAGHDHGDHEHGTP